MHAELQLDNQICFRLYTAARLVTQAYTPMLTELGITYPQYLVLMVLWEKDNQPVNDIAHRLLLETNTVTPLLHLLAFLCQTDNLLALVQFAFLASDDAKFLHTLE